jgi:hypothetical protein
MQFRIHLLGTPIDVAAVEDALLDRDPSALLDLDDGVLRVATQLGDAGLLAALAAGGCPVGDPQLERVPSECCGGCGG